MKRLASCQIDSNASVEVMKQCVLTVVNAERTRMTSKSLSRLAAITTATRTVVHELPNGAEILQEKIPLPPIINMLAKFFMSPNTWRVVAECSPTESGSQAHVSLPEFTYIKAIGAGALIPGSTSSPTENALVQRIAVKIAEQLKSEGYEGSVERKDTKIRL